MQVLLQHRRLLALAATLETLADAAATDDAAAPRFECGAQLAAFIEQLEEHFVVEVKTTSSDQVAVRDPKLLEELQSLDAEHPVLLEAFEAAQRLAVDTSRPPSELREAVFRAVSAFRAHEARENELFLQIF